jgi:hypothetical protein
MAISGLDAEDETIGQRRELNERETAKRYGLGCSTAVN